jgi:alcohol dehydrogenase
VDTYSTAKLLQMVAEGQIDTQALITHHLPLDDMLAAYDIFSDAAANGALKIVLTR